jgi:hypothetical protein
VAFSMAPHRDIKILDPSYNKGQIRPLLYEEQKIL